jgi:uncharacterized protein
MLASFMPKEEKYFDYFHEMIGFISEMATATQRLFSASPVDREQILVVMPLEKRCDEILRKVVKHLNKSFITPFDREDILALIHGLDDISDILMAACIRTDMFQISDPVEGAVELTQIVVKQIRELERVLHDLKHREDGDDACKAVKDLESEADVIYRSMMTKLFVEERDPIALLKKKEILDILENASDKCQTVANVITSIFVKNS